MYAVITGASSGFGLEFARQFAQRNYDLCIVARREIKLIEIKQELELAYGIKVDVLSADLSQISGLTKLYDFTQSKDVDVLVNNSGIAINGLVEVDALEQEMEMLDINVRAMHWLTRKYVADMLAKNKGRILNVASLSGWLPGPFMSAYAAGKAYILHLSEAFNFELKLIGSKVRISVVTPGMLNTGIAEAHGITMKDQGRSVAKYIEKVTKQFLRGREIILVGRDKEIWLLRGPFPRRLAKWILSRIVQHNFQVK